MHKEKLELIKTCAVLFIIGNRIKRQTRRLDKHLERRLPSSKRTVRTASALEHSRAVFDINERRAIRLFLLISAQQ